MMMTERRLPQLACACIGSKVRETLANQSSARGTQRQETEEEAEHGGRKDQERWCEREGTEAKAGAMVGVQTGFVPNPELFCP